MLIRFKINFHEHILSKQVFFHEIDNNFHFIAHILTDNSIFDVNPFIITIKYAQHQISSTAGCTKQSNT